MPPFINISGYKFVPLDQREALKTEFLPLCQSLQLKGTILLAEEGINLFLSGARTSIDSFLAALRQRPEFEDLEVKESLSDHQPFTRMLVRLKKEIISMGVQEIRPQQKTSPKISASELKSWLDEGRDITLLDVRNDYEIEVGTFANAIPIGIDHFRKFPEASAELPAEYREKPVVMFCTGGIRCEKAGPLMEQNGFQNIFQLDGGILKYFEECGGDHYQGDCFVFDQRVAVDSGLLETDATQCYGCQAVLTLADQQSPLYAPPHRCPHCSRAAEQSMAERLVRRAEALQAVTTPLPGCEPYENVRPMNVSAKFEGRPLLDFLISLHVDLDDVFWKSACAAGRVRYKDAPLAPDTTVRGGWRILHFTPQTTEPAVSNDVRFLYEDDRLIAIEKPAPLPMHPCGRFNRNTLQNFLRLTYPHEQIRILHRLDAATTGVLLLARDREIAATIQHQFKQGSVAKTYLALAEGHPKSDAFVCDAAISDKAVSAAGTRKIDPQGLSALTQFEVLQRKPDGTSLIRCVPQTGRTHQIRIHLAHLGHPIVGDPRYGTPGTHCATLEISTDSTSEKKHDKDRTPPASGTSNVPVFDASQMPVLHLHAAELEFTYPENERMKISAPLPAWAQ